MYLKLEFKYKIKVIGLKIVGIGGYVVQLVRINRRKKILSKEYKNNKMNSIKITIYRNTIPPRWLEFSKSSDDVFGIYIDSHRP